MISKVIREAREICEPYGVSPRSIEIETSRNPYLKRTYPHTLAPLNTRGEQRNAEDVINGYLGKRKLIRQQLSKVQDRFLKVKNEKNLLETKIKEMQEKAFEFACQKLLLSQNLQQTKDPEQKENLLKDLTSIKNQRERILAEIEHCELVLEEDYGLLEKELTDHKILLISQEKLLNDEITKLSRL